VAKEEVVKEEVDIVVEDLTGEVEIETGTEKVILEIMNLIAAGKEEEILTVEDSSIIEVEETVIEQRNIQTSSQIQMTQISTKSML
jgi:hypothetical protein